MRTELFTVSRIFTEALYRIPDYQRGYSWGKDELEDFWLDIEQLSGDSQHYTGVLTLEEVTRDKWASWAEDLWIIQSRKFRPYYVVDGQQRLTTVIILITTILELEKPTYLNHTSRDDVRRKYLFDSKPEDAARSYIFRYVKNNPSFEFLKTRIFCEPSQGFSPDEQTIYTRNLAFSKTFFAEKLASLTEDEIQILFTRVTQQLVFNVYEITPGIDVHVTFETMNNRGKLLSTLELLKNRLIYLASKLPAPDGRASVLRDAINDSWKAAYHYLGKNENRPLRDDDFLRTFITRYYLSGILKIPQSDSPEHDRARRRYEQAVEQLGRFLLNELFTPKRIGTSKKKGDDLPPITREYLFSFAQELKDSVKTYYELSTPSDSTLSEGEKIWLERIGRASGPSPSPLVMAIFRQETKLERRSALLELIDRYSMLSSFGIRNQQFYGRRFWSPEYFTKYCSGQLSTDELTTQLANLIGDSLKETSIGEVLQDWVKNSGGYYGWRSIKYFLYEYEHSLYQASRSGREKIDWREYSKEDFETDYETIEHIYPQKARDKYWTERFNKFTPVQKRLLRNSLGNLLPLSKPRNSSLSNRPFDVKTGDETNKIGYRFGSYSEIEVAQRNEWTAEEILERGIRLLDFLERRWKISIGDRAQKVKALGLGFMLK